MKFKGEGKSQVHKQMTLKLGQNCLAYTISCDGGICSASEKSAVRDTANSSGNDFIETHQNAPR